MRRPLPAVVILLLLRAPFAAAQDSLPAWTVPLTSLRPEQRLRLLTTASNLYLGDAIRVSRDTIAMTIPHIGPRAFPIDSIAQAWRPSNYCRTGFLVGAGIGAGTSVLLAGIARSLTYERYTASDAIKVGVVGGLVLGSIGYIIGGFIPGWRDIYHR